ncbi:MAG: hypothetical protein NZ849_00105 [Meiothermus sp.]|uniref:hypothetical protein n=1 Tax=Meiothermus sp. TaxID=1955249 RepID=UPI0025DFFD74|nr:hypothetical protein [Meiothermus sp.]MCS7058167.1 hypothetical protein [Meiothermus sp.]MCS7193318.1 hypothetical protein [Meiothermus sp.]MCX7740871.1 hypothetical protein [Meiothermus sp.]MDW8091212.1 hypothetical protein [Meiothermus sp.]MDW8482002.1 hypothetical protein [Meiothermus sp.]
MGVALLEVLLLLGVAGFVIWAVGASRPLSLPLREQHERLGRALAELRRQGRRHPHLREPLRQVQAYGRNLYKLFPKLTELERLCATPGLDYHTRTEVFARHTNLDRTLDQGIAYIERLGAELALTEGKGEPPGLAELPRYLIALREALHPPSIHQG